MTTFPTRIACATFILCISLFSKAQEATEKIWVTFESLEDVPELVAADLHSSNPEVQSLIEEFNIFSVEQAVPASTKEALRKVYEVSCNCNASDLSNAIAKKSRALTQPEAAPDYQLLSSPDDYTASFQDDYALDLIQAEGAWNYSIGDESIIIGISDANYYTAHEELESQIHNLDPTNNNSNYYHGTAVAITAAGHTNNGVGKSSIGYNCKMDLSALGYNKVLQMSQDGVRVINISWSSGCSPNSYVQTIVNEVHENGTILVAAAGNGSTCGGASNLVFPAACDNVISVTSVGEHDNHEKLIGDASSTHQHNSSVDICAPGYGVAISPLPGYYNHANGTSFAAPFVSGTIGLMLSLKPCLTQDQVIEILRLSSDDIYGLNPAYAGQLGWGRLNAEKALELTSLSNCSQDATSISTLNSSLTSNSIETSDVKTKSSVVADTENTELKDVINAHLFPNPTSGSATLTLNIEETMILTIVDARGVVIEKKELLPEMNRTDINVDQSGVYFIQVTGRNQQEWFGKLIKL